MSGFRAFSIEILKELSRLLQCAMSKGQVAATNENLWIIIMV